MAERITRKEALRLLKLCDDIRKNNWALEKTEHVTYDEIKGWRFGDAYLRGDLVTINCGDFEWIEGDL